MFINLGGPPVFKLQKIGQWWLINLEGLINHDLTFQCNQFPSQCDISCIISLEKAFFGAKSAVDQFASVFAWCMHLA